MQGSSDMTVLLSYPTLVGHIHLKKYLDSTSLLGRLLVIYMIHSFIAHLN
jgi:hypothetical protein